MSHTSQRGRHARVKATATADAASDITQTSTAIDTWSVHRQRDNDTSSATAPSTLSTLSTMAQRRGGSASEPLPG